MTDQSKAAADKAAADKAADNVAKSDPAPAPLSADKVAPAEPQPDPAPAAAGLDPNADPNPPTNAEDAITLDGKPLIVWVQPGHETFGIGQLLRVPADQAALLRSAGRARYASQAEIEAAGDNVLDVAGV